MNKGTIKSIIKKYENGETVISLVLNLDLKIDKDKQLIKIGDTYEEVASDNEYITNINNVDFFYGKKCYFKFNDSNEIIEIGMINEK